MTRIIAVCVSGVSFKVFSKVVFKTVSLLTNPFRPFQNGVDCGFPLEEQNCRILEQVGKFHQDHLGGWPKTSLGTGVGVLPA